MINDAVEFRVSIKIDINTLTQTLRPEQIEALFDGIGKVQAVMAAQSEPDEYRDSELSRSSKSGLK